MDYNDLKNGSIIVMTNCDNRIVIVNKVEKDIYEVPKLYTYVEFEDSDIFFEKEEVGYSYFLNKIEYRPATEEEKYTLYNAICKYFTEEYDKDWYNHFTDSSYFDIKDFLFDVFCIKVDEYDNELIYPDFVDDIHSYIWKKICKSLGCKAYDGDEFVEQLVNKQEFIEKTWQWLKAHIKFETVTYSDVWDTRLATDFNTVDEMEKSFRKIMED